MEPPPSFSHLSVKSHSPGPVDHGVEVDLKLTLILRASDRFVNENVVCAESSCTIQFILEVIDVEEIGVRTQDGTLRRATKYWYPVGRFTIYHNTRQSERIS